jgi:glyoxylase-like metal-dependent hydrolase (beta-lactamase superfamily II)
VGQLRERFPDLPVAKMIRNDAGLPEGITDLADGDRIEADGATLIAIHTPGHASDHLCFHLPEEQALFTGDLILSGSTTVIPEDDGDLGQYMDSLRRVQALGVRRIYSAHGPVIDDAAARIEEYIDHRMMRERQILDVLAGGVATVPAMVKIIYAEVPEKLHAMAGQSVHSHLKKLRREGRVSEEVLAGAPSRWRLV